MKKYALIPISLLLPFLVFAAYDDATMDSNADINLGGTILSLSGSGAIMEFIDVQSEYFTVRLLPGSEIQITADARNVLNHNAASQYVASNVCSGTESTLLLKMDSNHPGPFVQITVTPSSTLCGTTSQGGGGGGGGGSPGSAGSGSAPVVTVPSTPVVVAPVVAAPPVVSSPAASSIDAILARARALIAGTPLPTPPATPSPVAMAVSPVFNRALSVGSRGEDVKRLQQLLNSDPDTRISESGVGAPGNETDYLGSLTRNAVAKFQMKHGLVTAKTDPGYGLVGPKTRAKLAELFEGKKAESLAASPTPSFPTPPATPSPVAMAVSPVFNRPLSVGSRGEDVKRLQQLLNSDPDTRISESGVGAPGNETDYLGSLTRNAVAKFQMKHGLVTAKTDPGYGLVGPKTRAKLAELFEGKTPIKEEVKTEPADTPAPTEPAGTPAPEENTEASKRLESLTERLKALQQQLDSLE